MRLDGRVQVFPDCGYYLGRDRACSSHSKKTILVGARSISELRVTEATLGTSTRVIRRRRHSQSYRLALSRSGTPISSACNATIPSYVYAANRSMRNWYFYSADGELLLVPQLGRLALFTELGRIELSLRRLWFCPAVFASGSSCSIRKLAAMSARTMVRPSACPT
jgi:homogentisate 1,2-dioxygenase